MDKDCAVSQLPVDGESILFNDWNISYEKSHMLKSIDVGRRRMTVELCIYQHSLDLPHRPDMGFHKNKLVMQHMDGALMERIRVMPSGFFIVLRHFLLIDDVLMRMIGTRFHYEFENDYILKEVVHREAPCAKLRSSMAFWTNADEIALQANVQVVLQVANQPNPPTPTTVLQIL